MRDMANVVVTEKIQFVKAIYKWGIWFEFKSSTKKCCWTKPASEQTRKKWENRKKNVSNSPMIKTAMLRALGRRVASYEKTFYIISHKIGYLFGYFESISICQWHINYLNSQIVFFVNLSFDRIFYQSSQRRVFNWSIKSRLLCYLCQYHC